MTTERVSIKHPCPICMGFCNNITRQILCKHCMNWSHQECAKLSNVQLQRFLDTNSSNSYECKICQKSKVCEICQNNEIASHNSLYCVTCLKNFCDKCNSLSSNQINSFRTSDSPIYCSTCALEYPCIVCGDHCYNDTVNQPSIQCDLCENWVHHYCSKLTVNQFNKYGCTDTPYYCTSCICENIPYSKLSKAKFDKLEVDKSPPGAQRTNNSNPCTLCVACNNECNECITCPNTHRVCDDCIQCKYINLSQLNSLFNNKNNDDLTFIHINIRSLIKHSTNFENFIFNNFDTRPDVICITETKLGIPETESANLANEQKMLADLSAVSLPGYKFFHNDSKTAAGGSAIYISVNCDVKPRCDLEINIPGECEATFVEVQVKKPQKNLIIGSVYRHPHDNHDEFFTAFCEKIDHINKKYSLIILGDINIDYNSRIKNVKLYKDLLLSHGLSNVINLPKRITESTETLIDHVITNMDLESLNTGILTEVLSDHYPIFAVASCHTKKTSDFIQPRRNFSHSKKQAFINDLQTNLGNSLDLDNIDPNADLEKLVSIIRNSIKTIFPIVEMSNKKRRGLEILGSHLLSSSPLIVEMHSLMLL